MHAWIGYVLGIFLRRIIPETNAFSLGGSYTSKWPTSLILRDIAVRNLANDIAPVSRSDKGESGICALKSVAVSWDVRTDHMSALERCLTFDGNQFWYTSLGGRPESAIVTLLKLKGRKRLRKRKPSKGVSRFCLFGNLTKNEERATKGFAKW